MKEYLACSLVGVIFLPVSCIFLCGCYYIIGSNTDYLYLAQDYIYNYFNNLEGIFVCWVLFGNLGFALYMSFKLALEL